MGNFRDGGDEVHRGVMGVEVVQAERGVRIKKMKKSIKKDGKEVKEKVGQKNEAGTTAALAKFLK